MNDPAATPRQRVKAAGVAARYMHAYAGAADAPTVTVGEDKFGFKVDPVLARAERDDRVREATLWATAYTRKKGSQEEKLAELELEQIGKCRAGRVALLSFPDGYAFADRQNDENRLAQLYSKRLSRKKLTPEEDAEEAHLAVRVLKPEGDESLKRPIALWLSKLSMTMEWPTTRIAELDERVVGGETLTAAEEAERQDLRRQYPDSAAEADRIDHRYRYWLRKETEIAEKAGIEHSKAYKAASAKCEPLRDPTKIPHADLRSGIAPRIRELETLRWDNILTPEEAEELEELHRLYPERAERTRKFVDRRLSYDQANRDNMRRTGSDPGPIKEDGFPRNRTPTGRMAGR